ncbi:MAG: trigger factor [Gammaproteobacteria bacterium]
MDVILETPGGLVRQLRVRIPAERITSAVDTRLKQIASRAKIAGFRPGKAPLKVVEQQFGESARIEVIQDLVRGSYPEAVDKAGVHPATAPHFEVVAEQAGQPLEYLARFEVYPEIKLNALSELKVERPVAEIGAADVDKVVESMRRAQRTLAKVERKARDGDVCQMSFEGSVDGATFPGGKGDNVAVEIGQGRFLPDLETGLKGHGAGENFTVEVKFPDDYRNESLKGKTAQFKVELKDVQEPKLPELDEAFFKANGVEAGKGIEALRAKIQAALELERDKAVKARLKAQVLEQLLAANPIPVPQAMVAQETARLREEAAARFNAARMTPEQLAKLFPDEALAPNARRRVSLGLLIGEVIKQNKIVIDPARQEKLLDQIAGDYQQPDQIKQYYRGRADLMQGLRAMVMEEQVVESLLAAAKSKDAPMALDDLLKAAQQAS